MKGQSSLCENINFTDGNFDNWTGYTSVYPRATPGANIGGRIAYYYNEGIVDGRHTIINVSEYDPFTCGNVTTIAPGETQSVRLGNGGVGGWGNGVRWQRDYLEYTMSVTDANALLVYKYAVVLQDPNSDPGIAPHADPIKPRFVVSIMDETNALIDPVCGVYSVTADETVDGFRNCSQGEAEANGGAFASRGSTIYRAWTTVGVDLRDYIGSDVTLLFETWDCGLGGHFGYAYLNARCDSLGISAQSCAADDGVTLTAPEGFSYLWSTGQSTQTIDIPNAIAGDTVWVELTTKSGCSSELHTVLNPAKIEAQFKINNDNVCQGESINFTDSAWSKFLLDDTDVPITRKTWRFSDGTVVDAMTETVSHTFTDFGIQWARLIVENDYGCIDSVTKEVNIHPIPSADFVFDPNCLGKEVSFENSSLIAVGLITELDWLIADVYATNESKPKYIFQPNDSLKASLKVTSEYGCLDSVTKSVSLWPSPVADFSNGVKCLGKAMNFTNNSTSELIDPINQYRWDFGDSSALTILENPIHTYDSSGTFNVTLTVQTERGCSKDTTKEVLILEGPQIDFDFGFACLNAPVVFENNSLGKDSVVDWLWDFGDGNTSNAETPDYSYTTSDVFTVKLKGITGSGCEDSLSKNLLIAAIPEADFDADPVCLTEGTAFNDQSIVSTGDVDSWTWSLIDTVFSNDQNPVFIFDTAGAYNVQLKVESGIGCIDSVSKTVLVYPGPESGFSFTEVCFGEITEFTNESVSKLPGLIEYFWDFGNGTPNKEIADPTLVYNEAGKYEVTLSATQVGCTSIFKDSVTVKPRPVVDFTNLAVCLGVENEIKNATVSESPISTWEWSFAELGTQQFVEFPVVTVSSGDTFTVELIATANNGCADTLEKVLKVSPNPTVDFRFQKKCAGEEVNFTSQAVVTKGYISNWIWDFGDGTRVEEKDAVHTFRDTSGTIEVKLIAQTADGCEDSVTLDVDVYGKPTAYIKSDPVCLGTETYFEDSSYVENDNVISWEWNVGDGSLLKIQENLYHEYPKADTFNVELFVLTDKGCLDTATYKAVVYDNPVPNFSNSTSCYDAPTYFYNETLDTLEMKAYNWSFGDGDTSDLENPTHIYQETGLLSVKLHGIDTNNCEGEITKDIIVKDIPQPLFDANKYNGCNPRTIDFIDYSNAPLDTIVSWRWDFGDGDTSDLVYPVHEYDEPGQYTVSLEVATVNGCINSFNWDSMIHIYPIPVSDFSFSPEDATMLDPTIEFTDLSWGADYFRYEFGDLQVSSEQNPINIYKEYGDYEVTQVVSTRYGCADTSLRPLRIEPVFQMVSANAFTPNGDDVNDIFKPNVRGFDQSPDKYTFQIFNRWGDIIWETHDYTESWDGRVNTYEFLNTNKVQQVDVYVWKLIVWDITSDRDRHVYVGTVALIK